jgi:hypothetical protein
MSPGDGKEPVHTIVRRNASLVFCAATQEAKQAHAHHAADAIFPTEQNNATDEMKGTMLPGRS